MGGLAVRAYKFTNETKGALVVNLNRLLANSELSIPVKDKQLFNELELFTSEEMATGQVRYKHPDNYFDDCVMALGLAATTMKAGPFGQPQEAGSYTGNMFSEGESIPW